MQEIEQEEAQKKAQTMVEHYVGQHCKGMRAGTERKIEDTLPMNPLKVSCPRCHIMEGKRCLDMRRPEGPTRYLRGFHKERVTKAGDSSWVSRWSKVIKEI